MTLKLSATLMLTAAALSAQIRPVAASALSDGKLIILAEGNVLVVADGRSGELQKVRLPTFPDGIDMTAGGRLDENLIFVVTRGPIIQMSQVIRYSAQGQELGRWSLPDGYPSGLALDYTNKILYISSLQGESIYSVNLKGNGPMARYVAEVSGASRLASLALDPSTGRLFVADVFSGKIYIITLSTRKSSVLVEGLGNPSALAVGHGGQILYIADALNRCVWTVGMNANRPRASAFLSSSFKLQEPLALAVGIDGTIWVGDRSSRAIFGVDSNGRKVRVIR